MTEAGTSTHTRTDEAIAREEDKIPQSLTEKLRAAGYTLPEGTTF